MHLRGKRNGILLITIEDHVDPVSIPAELKVEVVIIGHPGHRFQLSHIPKPEENPVSLAEIVEKTLRHLEFDRTTFCGKISHTRFRTVHGKFSQDKAPGEKTACV